MSVQQKPILHGRDHCPGGADPIPCMIGAPAFGDFEGVVLQTTDLLAYWRLGETAGPWADTSGVGTPADLSDTGSGVAVTPDVTGALPGGQDDGAVEFNFDGAGTAAAGGHYLQNSGVSKSFSMEVTLGEMSVCAWVKLKASALNKRQLIIGNSTTLSGEHMKNGWALQAFSPGREVMFTRGQHFTGSDPEHYVITDGGVVAGEWNFFVGTYDLETIRLYANGALVGEAADSANVGFVEDSIRIGWSATSEDVGSVSYGWLYGTVDEAAVWTRALTLTEIGTLYGAGIGASSAGGQVLLTDGAGGTTWDFPLEVTF